MKILIDVCLTPRWCEILNKAGFESLHWSNVGPVSASDADILEWARDRNYILLTHDLDFGAILAATSADAPSVVQVRTQHPRPEAIGELLVAVLRRYETDLADGALLVVDPARSRIRRLPLSRE